MVMKVFKYLLPVAAIFSFGLLLGQTGLDQDNTRFDEELNERDWEALHDFINSKRTINVEEKDVNLTISGDVRTEWRHLNEWRKHKRVRGSGVFDRNSGLPVSRNDYDIEFNLRFDYVCQRAWAVAHVQYDNSAGVDDNGKDCCKDPEGYHGSGRCDDICLKKAYMGYNVWCEPCSRFDIELGRRNLYTVFDSNVQFLSRFDGLLLKYNAKIENITDWYLYAAGFLVDERVNHFGWVSELGFYNIYESGIDFKYSFIWWPKHGINRCRTNNPRGFRFLNSQWTLYYNFDPDCFYGKEAYLYGAFVVNHLAHGDIKVGRKLTRDEKEEGIKRKTFHKTANLAWYVGMTIGEVMNEGDWSLDIQYQWVEARAIPDNDVSGIGRGNVFGESFTVKGRGNTNFKGWRVEGLYALTDNLSLDTIIDHTVAIDKHIGGAHRYSKFELEAIYAF